VTPPVPALFRSIAEFTYDWETWVDAEGVARWINPAVERITGYTVDEALARDQLSLACEEDRSVLARVLADARAGGSGNDVEFRVRCKDGSLRWVAISWQSLRDEGQRLGYRTSIRDIEQRKKIEAELHVMRRRAEAAAEARTRLLANVSHELRSPVHCIAGFTEVLLEGALSAEQRHYLELIARECGGMLRHVEDLLQLAAIEAGGARLSPRPFELVELVQGVVEAARANADARGLRLTVTRPAETWLLGDPLRIGQVLRNLVDNALKFTNEGEVRVRVEARAAERAGKVVTLEVEDTGVGIDPAHVQRLLAPFEQASEPTRRTQGVGLGLSIVQRLIASMRGSLSIEGKLGEGTTVRVSLPLSEAQPTSPRSAPAPRQKAHDGATALVVDDSAPARELLTVLLTRSGYRVSEAGSSKEALARYAESPCELVLLDHQLPDADGIETALSLRRMASGAKLRIYLLTANVFARAQVVESRAAIDGVLEKPVGRADLLTMIAGETKPQSTSKPTRKLESTTLAKPGASSIDQRVVSDLREVTTAGGDLFEKLLASTREAMRGELSALERAARAEDRAELASSAHRVAGHAAIIGARGVAERARGLERGARRRRNLVREAERMRDAWAEAERALLALRRA
jgi:PAS domain S-box-containing protein